MLKLWGRASSFNVQKVLWTLSELDLKYQHINAGGDAGGLDTREFLAMNPHGKVPVLADDDKIIWESQSIVRYLAANYSNRSEHPLSATDTTIRAQQESWMDWSLSSLERDVLGIFWLLVRTPQAQQQPSRIQAHVKACARHYQLLDHLLEQQLWLACDHFSIADIPAGTTLFRYFEMAIERPELPQVQAWYARLQERPGYRQHVMRPFDELRGKLAF
ncbi:MAG: glutathione S-transferase family protein [Pseudomonadales bacterium]|nr:glutathione S-transferase family protein [Pseudomonadales bacterium]